MSIGCASSTGPGAPPAPAPGSYDFQGTRIEGNTRFTVSGRVIITADTLWMEMPGASCRQYRHDGDRVEVFCLASEVNVTTRQRAGFRFVWHRSDPSRDAYAGIIPGLRPVQRLQPCPLEPLLNDCYMEAIALGSARQVPLTVIPSRPEGGMAK